MKHPVNGLYTYISSLYKYITGIYIQAVYDIYTPYIQPVYLACLYVLYNTDKNGLHTSYYYRIEIPKTVNY